MSPSEHNPLPDVAVGHHPEFGIVAANPKHLPASQWMLERLNFHPVPGDPTLFALSDQHRDGQVRATRAVALLRRSGYQVDVDVAYDPSLPTRPGHPRVSLPRVEPDIAFGEHPALGVIAATADNAEAGVYGGRILEDHGWQHSVHLDVYTLPPGTDRGEAVGRVAGATLAMHGADLRVAVQPGLAQDVAVQSRAAPAPTGRNEREHGSARKFPDSTAALVASPGRTGATGKAPVATPAASPPAAPVDPRISFSRTR